MKKSTPEERYQNPCNDSEYWEMYKISENEGMNDWSKISFDPKKECDWTPTMILCTMHCRKLANGCV